MMNINYLVLIICCFGLSFVRGNAQALVQPVTDLNSFQAPTSDYYFVMPKQFNFKMPLRHYLSSQSYGLKDYPPVNHLPGMFCKLEYKIETKSKLAPRFRLGSLAYTEWMEGKNDGYMRYYK